MVDTVHVPAHLAPPGSLQAKQLCHLHTQISLGQSCHMQKMSCIYACRVTSVVSNSLWPCRLWPARLLCQGGVFSRQEYWSILANFGCHTLVEHYISCCPSRQLPWVPGQPQEQTSVDDLHAEVEVKPQLKPRGSVAKEEDPKPSHQLCKLQIKSAWSIRQTLCLWNI